MDIKKHIYLAQREYSVVNGLMTFQEFTEHFESSIYDEVYKHVEAEYVKSGNLSNIIKTPSFNGVDREMLMFIEKKLQEQCPITE